MRQQQQTLIVRRGGRRHKDEEEASSGAWKVAFADFTMAMMALFLMLWILSASSQKEREIVSQALRDYSILDGNPNPFELGHRPHPFDLEGYPSLIEGVANDILKNGSGRTGSSLYSSQFPDANNTGRSAWGESLDSLFGMPLTPDDTIKVLADLVREMGRQLGAMDNLAVDIVPQGLRIRLQDNDDRQMFERGGVDMDPFFEDMLLALAPVFARIDNAIILSGHTDSVPFQSQYYSNWELSGERAMTARRIMLAGGTPADRILQVTAMADRVPVDENTPDSSANRRIEILVLTEKAEADLLGLFDQSQPDSALNRARRAAEFNQPVTR